MHRTLLVALGVVLLSALASGSSDRIDLCENWYDNWCYRNHTQLATYLTNVVNKCPNIMQLSSIGQSVEGRDLYVVRIGSCVAWFA
jgi:hypothetical protein